MSVIFDENKPENCGDILIEDDCWIGARFLYIVYISKDKIYTRLNKEQTNT